MEAFNKVTTANSKAVFASDGQTSWKDFNDKATKKAKGSGGAVAGYSRTRHTPFFPKLGGGQKQGNLADDSNYQLGKTDQVKVPTGVSEAVLRKRKREKQIEEARLKRGLSDDEKDDDDDEKGDDDDEWVGNSGDDDDDGDYSTPAVVDSKWAKLTEPDTGKPYWFNNETGETSDVAPEAATDITAAKKTETKSDVPNFEACVSFNGMRKGRVFKKGKMGVGYYKDVSNTSSSYSVKQSGKQSSSSNKQSQSKAKEEIKSNEKSETAESKKRKDAPKTARERAMTQVQQAMARQASQASGNQATSANGAPTHDWEEIKNPLNFQVMYHNKVTKEMLMTRPAEMDAQPLKDEWVPAKCPESGLDYIYNSRTRQTVWGTVPPS